MGTSNTHIRYSLYHVWAFHHPYMLEVLIYIYIILRWKTLVYHCVVIQWYRLPNAFSCLWPENFIAAFIESQGLYICGLYDRRLMCFMRHYCYQWPWRTRRAEGQEATSARRRKHIAQAHLQMRSIHMLSHRYFTGRSHPKAKLKSTQTRVTCSRNTCTDSLHFFSGSHKTRILTLTNSGFVPSLPLLATFLLTQPWVISLSE